MDCHFVLTTPWSSGTSSHPLSLTDGRVEARSQTGHMECAESGLAGADLQVGVFSVCHTKCEGSNFMCLLMYLVLYIYPSSE